MIHKRIHILSILLILVSLFAALSTLAQSEKEPGTPEITTSSLCDIPATSDGMLFRQTWSQAATLPDERYPWQIANEAPPSHAFSIQRPLAGEWRVENQDLWQVGTDEGLSIAHETARDIGDGVVEGCMQFTSDITGVVPGGIVFRYQDIQNTYGVGFARIEGEVVFALGKMVDGDPAPLKSTVGYSPTQPHHVKIVLRGPNIKVYINGETIPVFDINDTAFASGKIGYVTYSSSARFGPLWADVDCSAFAADLSPIGQAVASELTPTVFCSNQYQDLTVITQDVTTGQTAFEQMADEIANAHYEVDLATLFWEASVQPNVQPKEQAGNIILQGLAQDSGLKELYRRFVARPRDYPQGLRIRILIGAGNTYGNVLQALQSITGTASATGTGIDLERVVSMGTSSTTWKIEIGEFRRPMYLFQYSHVKLPMSLS